MIHLKNLYIILSLYLKSKPREISQYHNLGFMLFLVFEHHLHHASVSALLLLIIECLSLIAFFVNDDTYLQSLRCSPLDQSWHTEIAQCLRVVQVVNLKEDTLVKVSMINTQYLFSCVSL